MKRLLITFGLIVGVASASLSASLAPPAQAINVFQGCGGSASESSVCRASNDDNFSELIRNVINLLIFVLGIAAVIMIIVGGLRYTTSNGDASNTKAAKDTILYSIVGLVVAIMAFAIVNFVIGYF